MLMSQKVQVASTKVPGPKYHLEYGSWSHKPSNIGYLDPLGVVCRGRRSSGDSLRSRPSEEEAARCWVAPRRSAPQFVSVLFCERVCVCVSVYIHISIYGMYMYIYIYTYGFVLCIASLSLSLYLFSVFFLFFAFRSGWGDGW